MFLYEELYGDDNEQTELFGELDKDLIKLRDKENEYTSKYINKYFERKKIADKYKELTGRDIEKDL